jgi:hypothetical protein
MVFGKITSLNRKRVSVLLNRVFDRLQRFVVAFMLTLDFKVLGGSAPSRWLRSTGRKQADQ